MASEDLARELQRLENAHDALDRRTRGLTWMIWGLVLPGISLTYSYAGNTMQDGATFPMWWFLVLWIPWVLLGAVVSAALWRSAGLMSKAARPIWHGIKAFLVFVGVTVILYLGYHFLKIYEVAAFVGPSVLLLMVGIGTLVLGLMRWAAPDSLERWLWAAGGATLILVTLVATWIVGPVSHDADPAAFVPALRAFAVIAPAAIASVYVGNGLYLSVRG